jgi:hypothetical protein
MGWNSWDSFATTLTEDQAIDNAKVMAKVLLPHGYDVFTVDIQWYEPGATGFDYRKDAHLELDPWGACCRPSTASPPRRTARGSSRWATGCTPWA